MALLLISAGTDAYTQAATPYGLSVSVDEVDLRFQAVGTRGRPVHNLKLDELSILDDGKPPERVLSFGSLQDFPIRAGILLDTSDSMEGYLARDRAIAAEYAQRLLRQKTDEAFVMDFARQSTVMQPWTSNTHLLTAGIHSVMPGGHQRDGTAIIDSLYRACLGEFGRLDRRDTANLILLFTDGEDNASLTSDKEAIDMCQRTNTAVYVFRAEHEASDSNGTNTLVNFASKSGGCVFYNDDSDAAIYDDLEIIDSDLRNQYRLIYKPAELKHDGSFHRVALKGPERVERFDVRSGDYAPLH